jgi:hypothetical protein
MHTLMYRPVVVSLFTLLLAGCSPEAPTGQVGAALVGPFPVDGSAGDGCTSPQTVCNVYGTALYTCQMVYNPDGTPFVNEWLAGAACPFRCHASQNASGLEQDYCGECVPGSTECVGGKTHVCTALGKWEINGTGVCDVCRNGLHWCGDDEGCQKVCI